MLEEENYELKMKLHDNIDAFSGNEKISEKKIAELKKMVLNYFICFSQIYQSFTLKLFMN